MYMLNGIRFWTINDVWRKILVELGGIYCENQSLADINIDSIDLPTEISIIELKSIILNEIDSNQQKIINKIFNHNVSLPRSQMQIIVLLFKTGGLSISDLKDLLGYAPDSSTHTVDTAIYQMRKTFGHEFIKNENGKYYIGKL